MEGYIGSTSSASLLAAQQVSSGQNSLQGALKNGTDIGKRSSISVSKSPRISSAVVAAEGEAALQWDMQRQLEDYNRSITIVVWYKADTEPIRLQHMNPTFPYFQLVQLSSLATDLGMTTGSYIDAYDPQSGKWEQHTMNTVRLVTTQQRLLYKTRRNLLEGLSEHQCPGLAEEVQGQSRAPSSTAPKLEPHHVGAPLKRAAPDGPSDGPAPKVHISSAYYASRAVAPSAVAGPSSPAAQETSIAPPADNTAPSTSYAYSPTVFYSQPQTSSTPPAPVSAAAPEVTLPPHLANPSTSAPPIPFHPHPPLKRWPNDYTVAELTAGFNAMELLIRSPPTGSTAPMTQRAAFERVFGSRYVKSTVCRHRGVWRKAKGELREQFEAMGSDERACWGEFVRRIEGRPPSKTVSAGAAPPMMPPPAPPQGVMMYHARPPGEMVGLRGVAGTMQSQALPRRAESEKGVVNEPVMASLQKPDEPDTVQSGQFP
ncbi:hypothetical protein LshimejAT787_0100210 [Lyophyllum shimeji]|uniref:Uncharacterized protein n=1 Tax=Lyophyllum shimeji TaxID=47721 RepID=A0A9P3PCX2_LYOSH|nr:hypothetical protein LshimejAT787_0100210 [Lyophyllum shimeji]